MTKAWAPLIEIETTEAIKKAQRILSELNNKQLIYAQRRVLKRLALKASTATASTTAKEVKVPVKLLRERLKLKHLNINDGAAANIRIYRTNIPAIRLGVPKTLLKRGKAPVSAVRREANGRFSKRDSAGETAIRVGRYTFKNTFLQKLKTGRWQIMGRLSEERYSIEAKGLPINETVTKHAKDSFSKAVNKELPEQMLRELVYRINKVTNG